MLTFCIKSLSRLLCTFFWSLPLSLAEPTPMIPLNIWLHDEESISSKMPRLTRANIDGKQTNHKSVSVERCEESARGPHLAALPTTAGCAPTHMAPECAPLLHLCCVCVLGWGRRGGICICVFATFVVRQRCFLSACIQIIITM